jgi:class 3 adenylate cyclase/tetratricopeptide (TPR) repeat protein
MAACPKCGQENPAGARFCHACAAPLAHTAAAHEVRKTVTVVFSDIVDSTPLGERLDPESLRRVMWRFFAEMRAALEAHGGTVERFAGDDVMAVFGVPTLHEDDALRAVRAASEMRQRLAGLNDELRRAYGVELEMRLGINTGRVVAGRADALTLATGDALNLGKRIQQAAEPGEILLGAETYRLVRDSVEAVPLEPRAVKGKADPVPFWRLQRILDPTAATRKRHSSLVGREAELAALVAEFERAVTERSSRLVIVLGPAGLGKSRLADEFLDRVAHRATTLRGQCLPYGDGITFWPLVQMVHGAGGEPAIREALEGRSDAELVVERILGVTGAAGEAGGGEETAWALRRLFEALARPRPLVLVFEDIHWGEPTLLDLIEYFAGWIRDAPVVLLCLARPDLLDRQPTWLAPRPNATAIPLAPLSDADTHRLLADSELGPAVRARIAAAAEGNPLFVEQMVALLAEEGVQGETIPIPPSIQALLAARLDRLTLEERAVLETAAVVGRGFWRGAVRDLAPPGLRSSIHTHLMALARKDFVESDASSLVHEDAFRFRHVLIRDAAYEGTPKERRAELHERFTTWIEANLGDRVTEREEIAGYHLEQAYRLRAELGPVAERERAIAARAAGMLGAAGRRALVRSDLPAAKSLLGRALELGGGDHPSRPLLLRELSAALWTSGELQRSEALLSQALDAAVAAGDRGLEWSARLEHGARRSLTATDATAELGRIAGEAVEVFEELGDDVGLAKAWLGLARVARVGCRFADSERAAERALAYADTTGDPNEAAKILDSLFTALLYGPIRADDASARCAEFATHAGGSPLVEANAASSRAGLEAMLGNFDEARALVARAAAIYDELEHRLYRAGLSEVAGPIELWAGRPDAAEEELRHGYAILSESGDTALVGYPALMLAETLLVQEREDEARSFAELGKAAISPDDTLDQVLARMVDARLRARAGDVTGAQADARHAVDLAAGTDALVLHADALARLAEILALAGRGSEARAAFDQAIELYERKGHVVSAARTAKAAAAVAEKAAAGRQ